MSARYFGPDRQTALDLAARGTGIDFQMLLKYVIWADMQRPPKLEECLLRRCHGPSQVRPKTHRTRDRIALRSTTALTNGGTIEVLFR